MEKLKGLVDGQKIFHIRRLLNADENLKSFLGTAEIFPKYSPLHNAVAKDHWDVCKILLDEYGVNPNAVCKYADGDRATALHIAAYFGSVQCLNYLLADYPVNPNLIGMFEGCSGTALEVATQREHAYVVLRACI